MKKARTKAVKHNLGGVNMSHDTWLTIKARFDKQRKADETFSAWVRRTLVAA